MLIRSSRLPKNQSAGCFDETHCRTVHHSPPKRIVPITPPATQDRNNVRVSFILVLLPFANGLVFAGNPMPRVQTSDGEPANQECQRPAMFAGVVLVQPKTESC